LFVGDAMIGVGLGKFCPRCQCQEPIFDLIFYWKLAIKWLYRGFVWQSSISGSKFMTKIQKNGFFCIDTLTASKKY